MLQERAKSSCFTLTKTLKTCWWLQIVTQLVGYQLCNPKIAAKYKTDELSNNLKMELKYLFCAGNLSNEAIKNFMTGLVCNTFCQKLIWLSFNKKKDL